VDVVNDIARLVEDLGRGQLHAVASVEQMRLVRDRKRFEQAIENGAGRV
jgi:hypothetical protein